MPRERARATTTFRLLIAFVALSLVAQGALAPPARADSGSITNIRQAGDYQVTATFTAVRDTCSDTYCGWFPVAYRTDASRSCADAYETVWVGPLQDGLGSVTETATIYPLSPGVTGPTKLCVLLYYDGVYHPVGEVTFAFPLNQPPPPVQPPAPAPVAPTPPGPVSPPPVAVDADLVRSPLYDTLGLDTDFSSFQLSLSGLPAGVTAARWRALVNAAAERWGLENAGQAYGSPVYGDGYDEVGFGSVRPGALASQSDNYIVRYRRKKRCRRTRRGRRCWIARRVVSEVLVDRDLRVSPRVRWQQGPAKPNAAEFDLQTIVLHELGHFAGNKRHSSRCRNTPMIVSLDRGEWWHSTSDRNVRCSRTPFARAASADVAHQTRARTWVEEGDKSPSAERARALARLAGAR